MEKIEPAKGKTSTSIPVEEKAEETKNDKAKSK